MKHKPRKCLGFAFVGCALAILGCGARTPATRVSTEGVHPGTTVDQVCTIVAKLFSVERSKITPQTSLGDLRADELDFVELVMELEEKFDISIPDDVAERMMGTGDLQRGLKNVTVGKLAALVDAQKRSSESGTRSSRPPARRVNPK